MSGPEGTFVDIGDGLSLHCNVVGDGRPVLWLHGSGPGASGWSNFAANARSLAEAGFQSVLLDSVGYGLSDKPVDRPYTLAFMAGCAVRVMEELGHSHYDIVGNSQGGAQAIRIGLDHPDRVRQLVLMAPGGLEKRETYMEMRGIRSMLRCIYGPEGITLDGMRRVFAKQLYDASGLPERVVVERYEAALTQPRHVFETMKVDNQEDRLSDLACPVLGLWGMNDLFCPPSGAQKLATAIPDCRVMQFNRCGHWVMVEYPAIFDRLTMDFLLNG